MRDKRIVYLLRSVLDADRYDVGLTSDLCTRLATHNSGGSVHARAARPWQLVASVEFREAASAIEFERYLKTGSGRAFATRHFR